MDVTEGIMHPLLQEPTLDCIVNNVSNLVNFQNFLKSFLKYKK